MAHSLTETSSFDTSIIVPDDADASSANSVGIPFQALANRSKFLNDHRQASGSESRAMFGDEFPAATGGFLLDSPLPFSWIDSVNTGSLLIIPLALPQAQILTDVRVYVRAGGGHTALPASMPVLKVFGVDFTSNTTTQIGSSQPDLSANVAAYEATTPHQIRLGSLTTAIDRTTTKYYAALFSEHGTNSVAGLTYFCTVATWTRATWGND